MNILTQTLPGRAAKGFITYLDKDTGAKLFEGDLRQCCHCQAFWTHRPGSGKLRGFCRNCMGHVCGKKTCMTHCYPSEQQIDDEEHIYYRNKKQIEAAVRKRAWLDSI